MELQELLDKLPPEMQALGVQYGPTVLKMSMADLQAWLDFVFLGNYIEAYKLYLKADDTDLLTEWDKIEAEWQEANEKNAAKMELSKEIAFAVSKVLVTLILAMVGL